MATKSWFDDVPVIGKMTSPQAAQKLRELGDTTTAEALEAEPGTRSLTLGMPDWWPFQDKPWRHTAHAFGYWRRLRLPKKCYQFATLATSLATTY